MYRLRRAIIWIKRLRRASPFLYRFSASCVLSILVSSISVAPLPNGQNASTLLPGAIWLAFILILSSSTASPFDNFRTIPAVSGGGAIGYAIVSTVCLILALVRGDIHRVEALVIVVALAGFGFFGVSALMLSVVVLLRRRFWPVFPGGHCRYCGYCLYGLPTPRCPECGRPCNAPNRKRIVGAGIRASNFIDAL